MDFLTIIRKFTKEKSLDTYSQISGEKVFRKTILSLHVCFFITGLRDNIVLNQTLFYAPDQFTGFLV